MHLGDEGAAEVDVDAGAAPTAGRPRLGDAAPLFSRRKPPGRAAEVTGSVTPRSRLGDADGCVVSWSLARAAAQSLERGLINAR